MAYTLNGVSLGNVQSETPNYQAALIPMPVYGSTSDETYVTDTGGVERKITISGTYVSTTPSLAQVWTFISNIAALISGNQDTFNGAPYTFISDLSGTIKVKIDSFNAIVDIPGFEVNYTLVLIESSTVL